LIPKSHATRSKQGILSMTKQKHNEATSREHLFDGSGISNTARTDRL
jgi:hypothetical protein